MKSFIKILAVFSILICSVYILLIKNYNFMKLHNVDLSNLPLNKLNQILSPKEQAALINQIVRDSLEDILSKNKMNNNNPSLNSKVITGTNKKNKSREDSILIQRLFHRAGDMNRNHSQRNSDLEVFEIQTTIEERQMMYTLLENFDKIMKNHNITYFMLGGTLLGSFRHHDLIPWDDDIDVIVPLTTRDNMEGIFKKYEPDYIFYRAGGHDKWFHKSAKKASKFGWRWPYLDISYYTENNTHITDWVSTYNRWFSFPKEIVFPLHNRPLLNLSLPAPKDSFAFLTWMYYYNSPCMMFGYSHMVEGSGPSGDTDCQTLVDKFPFVEHLPHKDGVREVLKFKELEITDIVVPEPNYAVSETFKLALKPGYTMPKNIIPPTEPPNH